MKQNQKHLTKDTNEEKIPGRARKRGMTDKRRPGSSHTSRRKDRPTIGFLVSEIQRDFALLPWLGMMDVARKHEVNLITFVGRVLSPSMGFEGQANVIYELAGPECVDGLIIWPEVMGGYLTKSEIEEFCRRYYPSVPVVLLEEIAIDDYQGLGQIVDHLIEVHGYRRIVFAGMFENNDGFRKRYRGYRDTMAAHGLPVEAKLDRPWFPSEVIYTDGRIHEDVLRSWLKEVLEAGTEAIVGLADSVTLEIVEVLQEQGIQIPGDIAVASFDDFRESRVVTPPLTATNPSFYELGQLAMEKLLARLKGKPVSEHGVVPSKLMVRQSCGCLDPAVTQAAVGPLKAGETVFRRKEVALEMAQAVGADAVTKELRQQVERLVDSFVTEATEAGAGVFLHDLEEVLQQIVKAGDEVTAWHGAISVLRRHALPWLGEGEVARAEDLWQQGRVLIGKMAERAQAYQRLQAEQRAGRLRDVGQALITTFDLDELIDMLAEKLPGLGIPGCYVSLYEQPRPYKYLDPAPEWSRLLLAYREGGRVEVEPEGWRFPSQQLVPEELWPQDRVFSLVVEPLYFQTEQIGFVLFEVGPAEGGMYEALRGQISSALKGALLVKQEEKRARQSQHIVEVSTAVSTILDTSELLQRVVDLSKASFNLYHAHIYLLNEAADTLTLAAGADEVGRQMVAQGWSIPLKKEQSLVAQAARTRRVVIENNVREAPDWLPNPLLPETRSELAVPMIVGNRVLGVLDVQAAEIGHFTEEDVRIQTTLVAQVAVALQNAHLFEQAQQTGYLLAERVKELDCLNDIGREAEEASSVSEFLQWVTERVPMAMRYPEECLVAIEFDGQVYGQAEAITLSKQMAHGLRIGGEVVGRIYLAYTKREDFIDEESMFLGGVARRVSAYIESRRLLEQVQARAYREQLLREVTSRIRSAADADTIMQVAAKEVGRALGRPAFVYLDNGEKQPTRQTDE
jgi:DNA-binding LacI/PurR family transcriptional regulator/GAF domain-containing protein